MQIIYVRPVFKNMPTTGKVAVAEWDKETQTLHIWRKAAGQPAVIKQPEPCATLRDAKKRIAAIYFSDKVV